jgi:sugar phosphate isomerase/epimerase
MSPAPLPYRVSFSSLGCPDLDWVDLCATAARHRIDDLEIRAIASELDLPTYLARQFGGPAQWAAAVEAAGMRICGLSTSLKLVGGTATDRTAFLRFLPWAEAVGGTLLRVFDGGTVDTALAGGAMAEACDTLAWWRDQRLSHGWASDVVIETHDSLVRSQSVVELQANLPQPIAILWDTHHTWKKGGEDPATTWAAIGQWVQHVHVKDSVSTPSARHPFTYVAPGQGEFPLDTTLRLLRDAPFGGVVSLEWEKMWHPYLGDINEALSAMSACHARAAAR